MNGTTTNITNSDTLGVINAVPVILLFVFGVCGNFIALTILSLTSDSHKWKPFYRFVFGLAVTDGGGLLLALPVSLSIHTSKIQRELSPALCDYQMFMIMFTLMSSAMIVCGMSFDRFYATLYPFQYNGPHTKIRTNILLAVIWGLSAIISSLPLFGFGSSRKFYPDMWCFLNFIETHIESNRTYAVIYATIGVITALVTWAFSIEIIGYYLYKRHSRESTWSGWKDLDIVIFLVTVVVLFTSCWFPLMVFNTILYLKFSI
jgi:prostaglandin E receptor 4